MRCSHARLTMRCTPLSPLLQDKTRRTLITGCVSPVYVDGRYVGAAAGSDEPGTYWVNTYDLPSRPLYVLPSLTLHEAVPGHHLQIAREAGHK